MFFRKHRYPEKTRTLNLLLTLGPLVLKSLSSGPQTIKGRKLQSQCISMITSIQQIDLNFPGFVSIYSLILQSLFVFMYYKKIRVDFILID